MRATAMKEGENIVDEEGEKSVGVGWFDLSGESTTSPPCHNLPPRRTCHLERRNSLSADGV